MKIVAHISDLHFGTEDVVVEEALFKDLERVNPAVVVISGDLTQRARTKQFEYAKAFLEKLKFPYIVIPGNHDIPLFDIFRRIFSPFTRYEKYITKDFYPVYKDNELLIVGVNTARNYTWKSGEISVEQIKIIKEKFCEASKDIFKILVTHHPFIPPPDQPEEKLVAGASLALDAIDECSIDLLLSGHLHKGYSSSVEAYYPKADRSVVAAQAGTAISRRRRSEPNTYNLITIEDVTFQIEVRKFEAGKFLSRDETEYLYIEEKDEWRKNDHPKP